MLRHAEESCNHLAGSWQCMETTESSWSSEGKAVNICFLGVNYTNMAWQKSHPGECTSLALPLEEMPSSAFFSANKIIPNAFLFIFYIRKDTNKHTQRPFPKWTSNKNPSKNPQRTPVTAKSSRNPCHEQKRALLKVIPNINSRNTPHKPASWAWHGMAWRVEAFQMVLQGFGMDCLWRRADMDHGYCQPINGKRRNHWVSFFFFFFSQLMIFFQSEGIPNDLYFKKEEEEEGNQ